MPAEASAGAAAGLEGVPAEPKESPAAPPPDGLAVPVAPLPVEAAAQGGLAAGHLVSALDAAPERDLADVPDEAFFATMLQIRSSMGLGFATGPHQSHDEFVDRVAAHFHAARQAIFARARAGAPDARARATAFPRELHATADAAGGLQDRGL